MKPIKLREDDSELEILREARERAKRAIDAWQHNFDLALDDLEFLNGNQWPTKDMRSRDGEDRPYLTVNKLPTYVDQIVGSQRQNRPAIHVSPVDMGNDEEVATAVGKKDKKLSEIFEGIIRHIERACDSEAHEDEAFQHAAESGFGWLRVYTDYSDNTHGEGVFDQEAKIRAIEDRFAVLMDPDATGPTFEDANWCFILEKMHKREFDKRYPDATVGTLGDSRAPDGFWYADDFITVAEYYRREPKKRKLLLLSDDRIVYEDEVEKTLDELEEEGVTVVREREIVTHKVIWEKITAHSRLETPTEWLGSTIPVVPVLGKVTRVGAKPYYRGIIRFAKDAQKILNFFLTAAVEKAALSPKAPWILSAEQIAGYDHLWQQANNRSYSYLPYNFVPGQPPPMRQIGSDLPAAELQLALSSTDAIKETTGIFDASLGAEGNEQSGKAIIARQRQGDTGAYTITDNMVRAKNRIGKILIEIIPKIFDQERVVRIVGVDGSEDWATVNQRIYDAESKDWQVVADLSAGKYDVTVTSGPSYQTQRMEAADSMITFLQAIPDAAGRVLDLIARNMDWPNSDEFEERFKQPEEDEEGEMAEPTPEQILAEADIRARLAESDAKVASAEATKAKAQSEMAQAQVPGEGEMVGVVREIVADALAELIQNNR